MKVLQRLDRFAAVGLVVTSIAATMGCDEAAVPAIDAGISQFDAVFGDGDVPFDGDVGPDLPAAVLVPPAGASSGGSGGAPAPTGTTVTVQGVLYLLVVPASYHTATAAPLVVAFAGDGGATAMTNLLLARIDVARLSDAILAVLDGRILDADAGAIALDDVRTRYNVDNDRTYLLSDSAGTAPGLELSFEARQSYFAAIWANNVDANALRAPHQTASELGFAPWGNVGAGDRLAAAIDLVASMRSAGYRLPEQAPYRGSGATSAGSTDQLEAALEFFSDKQRAESPQ